LSVPGEAAERLERSLFDRGFEVRLVRQDQCPAAALSAVLVALYSAGLVVIYAGHLPSLDLETLRKKSGGKFFDCPTSGNSEMAEETVERMLGIAETLRVNSEFQNPGARN
jgi:hypothetical protein